MTAVGRIARLLKDAFLMELALYRCLLRWVARRPDVPAGATSVGYARLVTPVMCLWIFASAAEVPLLDILLPWDALRIPLLALGVWGLAWMLGLLASYRVRPHLVTGDELRIRNGGRVDVAVPRDSVARMGVREADWPSSIRSIQWGAPGELAVAVSARTNVVAELTGPTTIRLPHGEREVSTVAFWVDDPREFVRSQPQSGQRRRA